MNITEVQIKNINTDPNKPVKAKVSVVIDNAIILQQIRVIEKYVDGVRKRFLAFPSQKIATLDDENEVVQSFFDIYHPINNEARKQFESVIYKALEEEKAKMKKHKAQPAEQIEN